MKTAWIVDDDTDMANAVQLMLQLLGFETTTFLDARSAGQALLSGKKPELLLLDINMPGVSGLELLRFIRQRSDSKNLPVIMLTSEAADIMVDTALDLGANAYLTKPMTIEELEKVTQQIFTEGGKKK